MVINDMLPEAKASSGFIFSWSIDPSRSSLPMVMTVEKRVRCTTVVLLLVEDMLEEDEIKNIPQRSTACERPPCWLYRSIKLGKG